MAKQTRTGRALTLFGLLAGATVGAAVAMVYAPHNGEGNRQELNRWAHKRLEEVQSRLGRSS
jgi:gas vesicle protein